MATKGAKNMDIAQEFRGFEENMNWLNKHYEKLKNSIPTNM